MAGRTVSFATDLAESGLLPDALVRAGIRQFLRQRLREERADAAERYRKLLGELRESPIALASDEANAQHYDVPVEFFRLVLGPRLKYSACYWPEGTRTLADAETAMLELVLARAGIADGMNVLDLGAGWGALTLFAAERFPRAHFLTVSSSEAQQRFVAERARALGLGNVETCQADVNTLNLERRFQRVVSVEMFEHVRNYGALLRRIAGWLEPGGRLFVHIFCHRHLMYPFETEGAGNWMGRHFFTGGLMPARDTLLNFQDHVTCRNQWEISGEHYRRTARAWLDSLDGNRDAAAAILANGGGRRAVQRWRMFFMACEELFGWRDGREWMVCHYLFDRVGSPPSSR